MLMGIMLTYRRSGNWSDLVELWLIIKQDRQKHANMLREALEKEIHK
jgi:hypothetical protein